MVQSLTESSREGRDEGVPSRGIVVHEVNLATVVLPGLPHPESHPLRITTWIRHIHPKAYVGESRNYAQRVGACSGFIWLIDAPFTHRNLT
ncbi:hypothetical protein SAY87_031345 [Trapa incisa]|uniref:Uncharacterized protein n=1 Tax=Trapa incisa TaxID=236973 RepID=A0AAN7KUU3_9MYRT|nr:hypothetical protein SAY87_031345 [Trapa incisa]